PGVLRTFVEIDGKRHELGLPAALLAGMSLNAAAPGDASQPAADAPDPHAVLTPVAGNLHAWAVEDGATVEKGQVIAIMEAMKMETSILAPCAGTVQISKEPGGYLEAKVVIGRVEAAD
ncbi:carbamoyl-phosphate synthase subunit L, partial [Pseudomonas savastanoi pv. glycinea str. race 4]